MYQIYVYTCLHTYIRMYVGIVCVHVLSHIMWTGWLGKPSKRYAAHNKQKTSVQRRGALRDLPRYFTKMISCT